ncbi:hypothetical protein JZ751_020473 [Albula glossodonta]|uniref:Uncharacterized protein n=1 Tax=Albula glossodonta TaxID=121402 RepID=A0A8T2PIP5_9TELE|nr:hypothetical protein JZ751_020473 [Albula glossodonta]
MWSSHVQCQISGEQISAVISPTLISVRMELQYKLNCGTERIMGPLLHFAKSVWKILETTAALSLFQNFLLMRWNCMGTML